MRDLIKIVLLELAEEYPQIEQVSCLWAVSSQGADTAMSPQAEYKKLVSLDTRVFSDLIPVTSGVA